MPPPPVAAGAKLRGGVGRRRRRGEAGREEAGHLPPRPSPLPALPWREGGGNASATRTRHAFGEHASGSGVPRVAVGRDMACDTLPVTVGAQGWGRGGRNARGSSLRSCPHTRHGGDGSWAGAHAPPPSPSARRYALMRRASVAARAAVASERKRGCLCGRGVPRKPPPRVCAAAPPMMKKSGP